ncbi:MAG: hypothetical protein HYZ26_08240 [Chloroflexi bacterium]|nr:hypothetical protein [Chloroflexota bacterium]
MPHASLKLTLAVVALAAASLACQVLGGGAAGSTPGPSGGGTQPGSPTPNLTLTAVFSRSATPLPSAQPSDTPSEAPSATLEPDAPSATAGSGPASPTPAQSGGGRGPTATATPIVYLTPQAGITPIALDFSPSPTLAATVTPGGSPTPAPPADPGRPGPAVEVVYLPQAPQIDADLRDFPAPVYAVTTAVQGGGYSSGEKDVSAQARFGWDEDYFYIGVRVFDNKFVQQASGPQLYRGDSLEILLDIQLNEDFSDRVLSLDDYQLGISPGNLFTGAPAEAYVWAPRNQIGAPQGVRIAAGFTTDGYIMEVAVPWAVFGVSPAQGQTFGFLFSVSDNDDVTSNAQQTVVSFAPGRALHDPTTWRDLILLAP